MGKAPMTARLLEILKEFQADSGTIHLLRDDGLLHLEASHGIPEQVVNLVRVVPVGKGMAGLAAERRQPVNVCNIQTDQSGDVRPGAKATGLQGSIAVPILHEGRVAGVLGVANRAERAFTGDEIARLLERAARLASD
jgi:L-methionine (R)-S-oxide reductase